MNLYKFNFSGKIILAICIMVASSYITFINEQARAQEPLLIRNQAVSENEEFLKTSKAYKDKADDLIKQGRYKEAEPLLRKSFAIQKQVFGENHLYTAASHTSIAKNLDMQGRHKEAEPIHRKALAINKKILGENHSYTARGRYDIAYNLARQARYKEAELLLKQAIAIMEAASLADHADTGGMRNLLKAVQNKINR
jgi:tetratricopeptide (TPR) repeat protein